MRLMARIASAASLVMALILIAAGVVATRREGGPVVLGSAVLSFDEAESGDSRNLTLALSNLGERPVHLLGSEDFCTRQGCARVTGLPLTIPARRNGTLVVKVEVGRPGDFEASLTVYTDSPGQPMIAFGVRGRVVSKTGGG